jgi:hypothetical protein
MARLIGKLSSNIVTNLLILPNSFNQFSPYMCMIDDVSSLYNPTCNCSCKVIKVNN